MLPLDFVGQLPLLPRRLVLGRLPGNLGRFKLLLEKGHVTGLLFNLLRSGGQRALDMAGLRSDLDQLPCNPVDPRGQIRLGREQTLPMRGQERVDLASLPLESLDKHVRLSRLRG